MNKKFFIAGKDPGHRERGPVNGNGRNGRDPGNGNGHNGRGPGIGNGHNRLLLSDDDFLSQYGSLDDGIPSWLSRADRRRLLQSPGGDGVLVGEYVTVAKDGSGNYTTITDAVNSAPNNSPDRYVIYVTAGVYEEYLQIPKNKYNIMLIGDGIDVTVITGKRSVMDGWTTFNSASFGNRTSDFNLVFCFSLLYWVTSKVLVFEMIF